MQKLMYNAEIYVHNLFSKWSTTRNTSTYREHEKVGMLTSILHFMDYSVIINQTFLTLNLRLLSWNSWKIRKNVRCIIICHKCNMLSAQKCSFTGFFHNQIV